MSSNYPCLSLEDNVVEYDETQKSNLSNLLNMYCLDSDNIQKMAPKPSPPEYLGHFIFITDLYLLVQKSGGGHGTRGTHLCDPDGSYENPK